MSTDSVKRIVIGGEVFCDDSYRERLEKAFAVEQNNTARLERELATAREEIARTVGYMTLDREEQAKWRKEGNAQTLAIAAERDLLKEKLAVADAALTRLRDCDWVITPHDRMDAVRTIAREALNRIDSL